MIRFVLAAVAAFFLAAAAAQAADARKGARPAAPASPCSTLQVEYPAVPAGYSTAEVRCGISRTGTVMVPGLIGGQTETMVVSVVAATGHCWVKEFTRSGNTLRVGFAPALLDPSRGPNRAAQFNCAAIPWVRGGGLL